MSRSKVDGEVWFWLIFGAIGGIIGGLIGLLIAWGIPFCGCIFD